MPDATPKLLDFGIAKILYPDLSTEPVETTAGASPMTPEYASPEQVQGKPVTPATDIYSLGVVLYVLLTGRLPYVVQSRDLHQMVRAICEQEPVKPGTAPGSARLAPDLEKIVLKALRKEPEPERRYGTKSRLRRTKGRSRRLCCGFRGTKPRPCSPTRCCFNPLRPAQARRRLNLAVLEGEVLYSYRMANRPQAVSR